MSKWHQDEMGQLEILPTKGDTDDCDMKQNPNEPKDEEMPPPRQDDPKYVHYDFEAVRVHVDDRFAHWPKEKHPEFEML